jgi:hypothetical protein
LLGALPAVFALTSLTASESRAADDPAAPINAAAKPRWQHLADLDGGPERQLTGIAWAEGRAWFVVGSSKNVTVASAPVRRNALASVATTRMPGPGEWKPIVVGSDLLYSSARGSSGIARLLPSGRVAPPAAASPEPLEKAPGVVVAAAARVGARMVYALAGGQPIGERGNSLPTLWACCDETGAARDLTSLITRKVASPPRAHSLGVDSAGRLWLAWLDGGETRATIRIVELDPSTLAPRSQKALNAPADRVFTYWLVCAARCRLVFNAARGNPRRVSIFSWTPGERSTAKLSVKRTREGYPGILAAAGYRSARLAFAYVQGSADYGPTLNVAVGDARGAHARLVASAHVPPRFSGLPLYAFSAGTLTPSSFVFAQTYQWGGRSRILATVLPLEGAR